MTESKLWMTLRQVSMITYKISSAMLFHSLLMANTVHGNAASFFSVSGRVSVLIATDVASRGLDIKDVT